MGALLLLVLADLASTLPPPPARVVVESRESDVPTERLVIRADAAPVPGERVRRVAPALLQQLAAVLAAPPVAALDPARVPLDRALLRRFAHMHAASVELPPRATERFIARVLDPAQLAARIRRVYASHWSDDEPSVRVTIAWPDGAVATLSSDRQHPFMVPWSIKRDGRTVETWDPELPRALAALLPREFRNQARIAGETLPWEIVLAVARDESTRRDAAAERAKEELLR